MARRDDAIKVFKDLANIAEVVVDASLNGNNAIIDSEDTDKAIRLLTKHRLAFRTDDDDSVKLSSTLTGLLQQALRNSQRIALDADIGGQLALMEDLIDSYREAKSKRSFQDVDRLVADIEEQTYGLVETIANASNRFSHHISSGFSYVTNLELRIKENEKVLAQARRLNKSLQHITIPEMAKLAKGDLLLCRLLLKVLPRAVQRARQELVHSLHRLTDMLFTMKQQQQMVILLRAFNAKYEQEPGYLPDTLDVLVKPPLCANTASPLNLSACADVYAATQEQNLQSLLVGVRKEPLKDEPAVAMPSMITDATELPDEVIENNRIVIQAEEFLLACQQASEPLSAKQAYEPISNECSLEIWLLALIHLMDGLPEVIKRGLQIRFDEEPHPLYQNNYDVRDLYVRLELP